MLLKTVHFVMSYTSWQAIKWQRKPFLLYWMCLLNLLWCWISAEAWSVHTGLSDKYAPLYKSLTTLRPLYLCPAGEQEVLNLATIVRLWRLYILHFTQQTPAISGLRNITPNENVWSDNENCCMISFLLSKGEKDITLPLVTRFWVHFLHSMSWLSLNASASLSTLAKNKLYDVYNGNALGEWMVTGLEWLVWLNISIPLCNS